MQKMFIKKKLTRLTQHAVSGWAFHKSKIMTQKEFIELSEKEVLSLNGHSITANGSRLCRRCGD